MYNRAESTDRRVALVWAADLRQNRPAPCSTWNKTTARTEPQPDHNELARRLAAAGLVL